MSRTIIISRLMELLRNTEDESGRFADPTVGLSVGARYLFDNVLIPLMNGAEVNTGSLDMDRFDREDIGTIFDFYTDNYTGYSQEFSRLRNYYDVCCGAPPVCRRTAFL